MRRIDGVLLEGEDIALAAVLARLGVAYLQRVNGSAPPAALQLRDELAAFARRTSPAQVTVTGEPANLPAAVIVADSAPQQMTAAQAAAVLGVTVQHACRLCRSGALVAIRTPAGHWQVDADSAAALAERRKERT